MRFLTLYSQTVAAMAISMQQLLVWSRLIFTNPTGQLANIITTI